MMEDARDLPDGATLDADVCIVGAGAAGIAMVLDFMGTDLRVLLLESGGLTFEKDTQALYSGSVVDPHLHSPPDRYRQRCFGGSTTIWGGRCVPFDPIDFEARSYVAHSGWPFGLEELMPHYRRANRLCEAGEFAYTVAEAFTAPRREMIEGLRSSAFSSDTLERFSCPTDFGARYAHRLRAAANVRVLLHANVTGVGLNPAGRAVERLTVRTLTGKTVTVGATHVVLATGGLEVARLLLANRDVHRDGIGNGHDVVGRYYMCHLAGTLGALTVPRPASVWHGYDIADDGAYCRRRLALAPQVQRELHIGNLVARLHHPRIVDPDHRTGILSLLYLARALIPYEYARRLDDGGAAGPLRWLQHARNVILDLPATLAFAWHLLRDRRLAERKFPSIIVKPKNNCYSLDVHAEQQPNPLSRVTLGAERDALGLPRLHIDWRYTRRDVETVQRALTLFAREIDHSRAGRFEYNPQAVEMEMTRYGAYGGHHLGTARMGTDPRSSATDAQGRVHGVDNLFVAGAALFPTSGQANPTLTIVALALRTAAHLKQLLARQALTEMLVIPPRVVPMRARVSA
jgi:choline dehydrogenase-like flavoprotein